MPPPPIKTAVSIATLVAALIAIAASLLLTPRMPSRSPISAISGIFSSLSSSTKASPTTNMTVSRSVVKTVYAIEQGEGQGAVVRRSLGSMSLRNLSPFLMLDYFTVKEGAGFPDHPHRGMTTVTYMLDGYVQHEDFAGHRGKVAPGDLQWMSAGRGIMHAEMPVHRDAAGTKLPDPVGFQLWIDLPAEAKKSEPTYQEHPAEEVPLATPRSSEPTETEGHGWEVKVLSGSSHGVSSPVRTPKNGAVWFLDVRLKSPGARIFQELPTGFTSFIYSFGEALIKVGDDSTEYKPHHTLVLSNKAQVDSAPADVSQVPQENGVWVEHAGKEGEEARFLILAGQPLDQEVVQYGPFVVTSRAEVQQAIRDFQMGTNGFEAAPGWRSSIAKGV